eukprot:Trichotokara_eunicae@DN5296_c0_g1_i1.p1
MEGLHSTPNNKAVLVLAATNLPWELDIAMRRRFDRRIYIPLPDEPARRRVVEIAIAKTRHTLNDVEISNIAKRTEGFSGSDMGNLAKAALMEPVRRCRLSTHFRQVTKPDGAEGWTPCPPPAKGINDPKVKETKLMSIKGDQLVPPPLQFSDFMVALSTTRPTVVAKDLIRHQEWTEQFGFEGR